MKSDVLKEYAALRALLEKERAQLQDRLDRINALLSGQSTDVEKAVADLRGKKQRGRAKGVKQVVSAQKGKKRGPRKMSEAAKARIAAAQKQRWERIRAQKAASAGAAPAAPAEQSASPAPQA